MFVRDLRLVNFRSYCDTTVRFGPGLNVIVGDNATGKTNLLEGAFFALRGASPRTRRDDKLVTWGERFARVTVRVEGLGDRAQEVEVAYAPGEGKRVRWDGLEVAAGDELRRRCPVFIFVPESLLLVKGSPARRRAHLDAFAAAIDAGYAAAARDLQTALRQRNAQLAAVRAGAPVATLDPWDAQFARAAVELGRRRAALVAELGRRFSDAAAALAPAGVRLVVEHVDQLGALGYDEGATRERLRERRPVEIRRALTLVGPHRDDLRFLEVGGADPAGRDGLREGGPWRGDGTWGGDMATGGAVTTGGDGAGISCGPPGLPAAGRDLRLFGSQGEQRSAVLALLLAEQALVAERTGEVGALFLDDVMSELDDRRRRLLVKMLAGAGQAIVTTTDRHYFTDDELAAATVIELPLAGSTAAGSTAAGSTAASDRSASSSGRGGA